MTMKIPELRSIRFIGEQYGWVAGYENVFYTKDGGTTWEKRALPAGSQTRNGVPAIYDLGLIAWADRNSVIVVNMAGFVVWDAHLARWKQMTLPKAFQGRLEALAFSDSRHGWGVGSSGVVRTNDSGASWRLVDERVPVVKALFVRSTNEVWLGGSDGALFSTRDGGRSWSQHELDLEDASPLDISCLRFFEWGDGWLGGTGKVILRTRNGGLLWSRIALPPLLHPMVQGISFVNGNEGWVVGCQDKVSSGREGLILHTTDAGETWEQQTLNGRDIGCLVDVQALSKGQVWTAADSGAVLKSEDNGRTWVPVRIE